MDIRELETEHLDREHEDTARGDCILCDEVSALVDCADCHDTRRVPIFDCDDDDLCFTGCWSCNEDDAAAWDDSRCPLCGGPFLYPYCVAGCFGFEVRDEDGETIGTMDAYGLSIIAELSSDGWDYR